MGSSYFHLEFLLAWSSLLKAAGYQNPAIFALDYTLVPDAIYPAQHKEAIASYNYVCSLVCDASRICVGGDSAGATLVLSLLLHISKSPDHEKRRPGYATLISPWVTLVSANDRDTPSDYLNTDSLHLYGRQYAGSEANLNDLFVSPGACKDAHLWAKASPGFLFLYGSEEVFGPEIRDFVALLRSGGCSVSVKEEPGSIHAWPLASMFLSDTRAERLKGLRSLVKSIEQNIHI